MNRRLPLTPFEELMFWEDRPAYPFSVYLRLRFTGQLNRGAFEAAMGRAISRHPLLRSRIEIHGRRCHWVTADEQPVLEWMETTDGLCDEFPPCKHLNLQTEIGLRVYVTVGLQKTDVVLQFHHACCDGAGFLSFLSDFFIAYALERGESPRLIQLPEVDDARLGERGRYGLTWWRFLKLLPRQMIGLQGVAQFLGRRPTPLTPHAVRQDDDSLPTHYPATVQHLFSEDETIRLRQAAQRLKVSANDLMARDVFLAVMRWRRELSYGDDREWIRMMVPMNMRSAEDRKLPAANVVSSVFLDRRCADTADSAKLLASIHDEMELIKRNQLGLTFLFSLQIAQWLPGGIRRSTRDDKCQVSCVFTNLGKVFSRTKLPKLAGRLVVGDTSVETFRVLAPIRRYNSTSFCAHQYAGEMGIDLHYDSGLLNAEQARRLIDLFVEQSQRSIC